MAKKTRDRLWVARDLSTEDDEIVTYDLYIGSDRPTYEDGVYLSHSTCSMLNCFCPKYWNLITGVRLKRGECREIESITVKLASKQPAKKRVKAK